MNKKEVGQLLNYVNAAYPNFLKDNDPVIVLDFWFRSLKEFGYEQVLNNLVTYAQGNEYPPKVKDLVNGLVVNEKYNIPGIEETKKIIEQYQVPKEQRMDKDELRALIDKTVSEIKRRGK